MELKVTGGHWVPASAAVAVGILTLVLSALARDPSALPAWDFRVFWEAVRATDIYAPSETPFINPPSALVFFSPLSLVGFWPGFVVWTIASVAAFVAAVRLSYSWQITLLTLLSPLVIRPAVLGQPTLLLGAAIIWAFAKPGMLAGIILGFVASIKPQMLLLAPVALAFRQEWRMLAGAMMGGISSFLFSLILFSPSLWFDWYRALVPFQTAAEATGVLQHSVGWAGFARSLGAPPLPFFLAALTFSVAVVAILSRRSQGAHLAALIVGASAIAAPYSLPHDLVILAPVAATVLLRPVRSTSLLSFLVFCSIFLPGTVALSGGLMAFRTYRRSDMNGLPPSQKTRLNNRPPKI